jgi:hypothetical protein
LIKNVDQFSMQICGVSGSLLGAIQHTPLELAEYLLENPDEFEQLLKDRAKFGARCATAEELQQVVQALENVAAVC